MATISKKKLLNSADKKSQGDNADAYSKKELEDFCRQYGVAVTGTKGELIERLVEVLPKKSTTNKKTITKPAQKVVIEQKIVIKQIESKEPNYDKLIQSAMTNSDPDSYLNVDTGRFVGSDTALKKNHRDDKYGLVGMDKSVFKACMCKLDEEATNILNMIIAHINSGVKGYLDLEGGTVVQTAMALKKLNHEKLKFCTERDRLFRIILDEDNIQYIEDQIPIIQQEGAKTRSASNREKVCAKTRYEVWRQYNGNSMDGLCYCCNDGLNLENFQAGHVIAKAKGGSNKIDNLRPVCGQCNKSMSTMDMREFVKQNGLKGRMAKEQ